MVNTIHVAQNRIGLTVLLSKEIIFVCVLIIQLQFKFLSRGLMDDKLHTDKEKVDVY